MRFWRWRSPDRSGRSADDPGPGSRNHRRAECRSGGVHLSELPEVPRLVALKATGVRIAIDAFEALSPCRNQTPFRTSSVGCITCLRVGTVATNSMG